MRRFLTALCAALSLCGASLVMAQDTVAVAAAAPAVGAAAAPAAAPAAPDAPVAQPLPRGIIKLTGNITAGAKIFAEGKGEAPPCLSCHGDTGLGDDNLGTPRLAGQGFVYLRKQLYEYAADRRTDTTMGVMNGVAKALSDQDKADVSAYESSVHQGALAAASNLEEVKAAGTVPVGERHLGKGIVLYGIPEQGVPACGSCHQYNGRGALPVYPTIGGQRYVYLVNQLKQWREGTRANDPLAQMRIVASKLKDEDIYNVAAYLTSAPPISGGNSHQPHQLQPAAAGVSAAH